MLAGDPGISQNWPAQAEAIPQNTNHKKQTKKETDAPESQNIVGRKAGGGHRQTREKRERLKVEDNVLLESPNVCASHVGMVMHIPILVRMFPDQNSQKSALRVTQVCLSTHLTILCLPHKQEKLNHLNKVETGEMQVRLGKAPSTHLKSRTAEGSCQ